MEKRKANIVTLVFAVMLAGLDFCLWRINLIGFAVLTGTLALFGYWEAARVFAAWLTEKQEDELTPVVASEVDLLPPDFSATVEEIMAEVQSEQSA